jgi:hypothetical protein
LSVDEISLTLPADDAFHGVAHLVLGGLAVRLDLTYEHLEDLELALDALLDRTGSDEDVTVRVRVLDGELQTLVGPFKSVRAELDDGAEGMLNLRRILGTVCDRVEVTDLDGRQWVQLTKRVEIRKDTPA